MLPLVSHNFVLGVRCILEHVVFLIGLTLGNLLSLLVDAIHYLTEAVEFGLAFALGGLYHKRTMYGERERRSVVAKVHQALGDIVFIYSGLFFYLAAL